MPLFQDMRLCIQCHKPFHYQDGWCCPDMKHADACSNKCHDEHMNEPDADKDHSKAHLD